MVLINYVQWSVTDAWHFVQLHPNLCIPEWELPGMESDCNNEWYSEKKISGQSHNAQCFYVILDQPPIMHNAFMMTKINSANFFHTAEYMFTQALFWRTQFK